MSIDDLTRSAAEDLRVTAAATFDVNGGLERIPVSSRRRSIAQQGTVLVMVVLVLIAGVFAVRPYVRTTPEPGATGTPTPSVSQRTPAPTPTEPYPTDYALDASLLTPPLTARLPPWVESVAERSSGYSFTQRLSCPTGLCPDGQDRQIAIMTVPYVYRLDATNATRPSYTDLISAWTDVQRLGYGNVSNITATQVGGRPATTMMVALTRMAAGLVRCEQASGPRDGCQGADQNSRLFLAIVDQGQGQSPTLLYESLNTTNTRDEQAVANEFRTWLSTVRFWGGSR